jgi:ADP-ribose pyrophosphatase YjhB (NUDIX family)
MWKHEQPTQTTKSSLTVLRKSAYIISVISERDFIQRGGQALPCGIYYISKTFQGTPEHETVALVGIPLLHISSFFEESSELIEQIKQFPELQYIQGIDDLSCMHTCILLKKFQAFFDSCESHYLVLLNIEPKGEGRYQRIYPFPRFTIPGGTMEDQDSNDFLQCALREFKEETHLELTDNYTLAFSKKIIRDIYRQRKRQKKYNIFDRHREQEQHHEDDDVAPPLPTSASFGTKPSKVVSMYFAIRIHF